MKMEKKIMLEDECKSCDDMTLDEAWKLIGEACYAYDNRNVRYALMVIRASVAEMRIKLNPNYKEELIQKTKSQTMEDSP